jgi:hypothetical protein
VSAIIECLEQRGGGDTGDDRGSGFPIQRRETPSANRARRSAFSA